MNSMEIMYIDHINIVVNDLEKCRSFFEDIGFIKDAQKCLHGKWVDQTVGLDGVDAEFASLSLPNSQTVIELLKYNHPTNIDSDDKSISNKPGFRHIAFRVKDANHWYRKLEKMGVTCRSIVQEVPNYRNKKIFYFEGPEGILLEIAEYPE